MAIATFASPYALVAFASLFIYFIAYPVAIYFHDARGLRKYPGVTPFSGIWNLPFMIIAHGGFRSRHLAEMHKIHPVIRIGPNSLSYGDHRAIKDIYGHSSKATKDASYVLTSGSHFHLADVIDKPEHARKRKVLSAAYALKNLEEWEHKVADKTQRLIKQFDQRCTAAPAHKNTVSDPSELTVDYRAWTNFFTLDAIADIGLSEILGFLDNGSDRVTSRAPDGTLSEVNFRECLYETAHKQSLLVWSYDWYKILMKVSNIIPFYGRMAKLNVGWDGVYLNLAHKRMARYEAGEKLDDFFQALMETKNGNPNNLEWGEICAEVSIMMNAGSATTAIAMTNVLYQLLKNPEIMEKVRAEVDSALDEDDIIAPFDKVKHLPYLRACLDESLRFFPPTTHGLPREVPPEGMPILDDFIAGGTTVAMSAYVAHRDESVYPQADKFIPERFLGEKGKELQPYFIAFSAGSRGCIGRNISYLEQTVLLASVLHRYEFALPSPDWELKRLETMNLLLGEMPVKVWRRQAKSEADLLA